MNLLTEAMNALGAAVLPVVAPGAMSKAIATLTLGQQEGISNYAVSADFAGDTGNLKPSLVSIASTARLKSCPFKTRI